MSNKIWIFCILMLLVTLCKASWGTPGTGQYHIQTDEGPERYFRYQTDNGQYRKEKRLKDGTVIGTDAWIDAAGFLRSKDYIADGQGYRILKSKTVYVGQGRPIEEAIRAMKNVPAQSGVLVNPGRVSPVVTTFKPSTYYSSSVPTTTVSPLPSTTAFYSPPVTSPTVPFNGYQYPSVSPQVFVRHHSEPFENREQENSINSISNYFPTSTARPFTSVPSTTYEPPFQYNRDRDEQLKPIAIIHSTPLPVTTNRYHPSTTTQTSQISTTTANHSPFSTTYPSVSSSITPITSSISSTTYRPDITSTTFGYSSRYPTNSISSYTPTTDRPFYETSTIRPIVPFEENDLKVQPLFGGRPIYVASSTPIPPLIHKNSVLPVIHNNNLGNGYDPQFPKYDGVAVNRNGFSYYLPRQYHEEDNSDPDRRNGGFGYIDPFGIRRVIYYNTSPEKGFEHRKNNRYVGFDATPYDPRPY